MKKQKESKYKLVVIVIEEVNSDLAVPALQLETEFSVSKQVMLDALEDAAYQIKKI